MGKEKMKGVNILFVCKFNRFRSRVALAYFNKINKNKNIRAKSAGLIKGNPVSGEGVYTAKRLGLNIVGKTQTMSSKLLSQTDVIIIVANDIPKEIFRIKGKYIQRVVDWKIKDSNKGKNSEKVIKEIIKKVDKLNQELNEK